MIETITNIPLLVVAAVACSGVLWIAGLLVDEFGAGWGTWQIGAGLMTLGVLTLVVGIPAAALLSGISLGEIIVALATVFLAGGVIVVALVAIGIVLFILANVFLPVEL